MLTFKTLIAALLLLICQFTDSKRLQDNDFARQFLYRGSLEPMRYFMNRDSGIYIAKRVPSAADMMIRFGKRFAPYDQSVRSNDYDNYIA